MCSPGELLATTGQKSQFQAPQTPPPLVRPAPSHGQPHHVLGPHLWPTSLSSCLQTKSQRQQKTFTLCTLGRKDIVRNLPAFAEVTCHNDTGGKYIYGEKFDDDNFILKHVDPGILSMANARPNTEDSVLIVLPRQRGWPASTWSLVLGKAKDSRDVVKAIDASGPGRPRPAQRPHC